MMSALSFEKVHRQTIDNGETIAYRKKDGGPYNLVLIHGNLSASTHWDLLMEAISDDFTVYAFDLRGFGESSYENPVESIKDLAEDIAQASDALGVDTYSVSGWGIGGAVAMRLALDHPDDVETLILLASCEVEGRPIKKRRFFGFLQAPGYIDTMKEMRKFLKPLQRVRERKSPVKLKRILNAAIFTKDKPHDRRYDRYIDALLKQRNHAEVNLAISRFNISNKHNGLTEGTGEIEKLTLPTLILHGDEDKVFMPEIAESNAEQLPNAELNIIEGASHAIFVDQVRTVTDHFERFIKKQTT